MKKRIASILLTLTLIFAASCNSKGEFFLSSGYTVNIIKGNEKKALALSADLDAFEKLSSTRLKTSEVYKINNSKANIAIKVSDEILVLFSVAQELYEETDAILNCAIYPAVRFWGFDGGEENIPTDEELQEVMRFCDMNHFFVDYNNKTVTKKFDQNQIDFGAIAKGYIAGKISIKAQSFVQSGILNLLGNIGVIGSNTAAGRDFLIGIRHPRAFETGEAFATTVSMKDCYASTSSDSERFFEKDGVRYCHILDGRTGKQAETDLLSATAISPDLSQRNATLTDAFSTVLFILGSEKAKVFAMQKGFGFVGVTKEYSVISV